MKWRGLFGAIASVSAFAALVSAAPAFDATRYPDWTGQWARIGDGRWDQTKPRRAQGAPLTPEYQAILDASLADQQAGGQGNDVLAHCIPPGMPRMMLAYNPFEFIVLPETTYIALEHMSQLRRVYTDGREWPAKIEPSLVGYSIGQWVDEDSDGRYDALLIETRGIKGLRAFDSSGVPLHRDNLTIVKERIGFEKGERNILVNEITTIDDALTRPWTIIRKYQREKQVMWMEHVCKETVYHIFLGEENYMLSADGFLMPARKDQRPPDLRHFEQAQK